MANNNNQRSGGGNGSQGVRWQVILSTVASLLGILAFLGIADIGQLRQRFVAGSPSSTPPVTSPFAASPTSYSPLPTPSVDEAGPTDTPTATPETSTFDPDSLDDDDTDETPFTQAALLATGFTDRLGVKYKQVASQEQACTAAYAMTSNVRNALSAHGCTVTMTGDFLVDSATVTDRSDILVSVQVFAFADSAAAQQVYDSVPRDGTWDFGIWCPRSGRGQNVCAAGYGSARKSGYIRRYHRYLISAKALYTTLGDDASLQKWVDAAASKAVDECGPENYTSTS